MNTHEITDAELIRYLDGELRGADRSELDARLAATPAAAERLAALRQRSARLAGLIGTADPNELETQRSARAIRAQVEKAERTQRWLPRMSPALRAAAVITLLLGFGLAVPPVRAWMIEQVRQLVAALREPAAQPQPPAQTTPAAAQPQEAPVAIGFAVSSDTFTIIALNAQGELIVQRDTITRASAEQAANSGANLLVAPNGLRIEGGTPEAIHTLRLPERVRMVVFRRQNGVVEWLPMRVNGLPLTLRLGR